MPLNNLNGYYIKVILRLLMMGDIKSSLTILIYLIRTHKGKYISLDEMNKVANLIRKTH